MRRTVSDEGAQGVVDCSTPVWEMEVLLCPNFDFGLPALRRCLIRHSKSSTKTEHGSLFLAVATVPYESFQQESTPGPRHSQPGQAQCQHAPCCFFLEASIQPVFSPNFGFKLICRPDQSSEPEWVLKPERRPPQFDQVCLFSRWTLAFGLCDLDLKLTHLAARAPLQ